MIHSEGSKGGGVNLLKSEELAQPHSPPPMPTISLGDNLLNKIIEGEELTLVLQNTC